MAALPNYEIREWGDLQITGIEEEGNAFHPSLLLTDEKAADGRPVQLLHLGHIQARMETLPGLVADDVCGMLHMLGKQQATIELLKNEVKLLQQRRKR